MPYVLPTSPLRIVLLSGEEGGDSHFVSRVASHVCYGRATARVPMKLVSEMLGHTTTAITADIYTHATDSGMRDASELVGESLRAAGRNAV